MKLNVANFCPNSESTVVVKKSAVYPHVVHGLLWYIDLGRTLAAKQKIAGASATLSTEGFLK
jgi:hypothetical protein